MSIPIDFAHFLNKLLTDDEHSKIFKLNKKKTNRSVEQSI